MVFQTSAREGNDGDAISRQHDLSPQEPQSDVSQTGQGARVCRDGQDGCG